MTTSIRSNPNPLAGMKFYSDEHSTDGATPEEAAKANLRAAGRHIMQALPYVGVVTSVILAYDGYGDDEAMQHGAGAAALSASSRIAGGVTQAIGTVAPQLAADTLGLASGISNAVSVVHFALGAKDLVDAAAIAGTDYAQRAATQVHEWFAPSAEPANR